MATRALMQPICYKNRNHSSPEFVGGYEQEDTIKEDASQSWTAGALVYQTGGQIAIATATSQLLGQALRAATAVENSVVENLKVIRPGDRFWMNVYHATAASAVFALADLGTTHRIIVVSGKFHVDYETGGAGTTLSDATNVYPGVKIVEFHPDDTITDIYGRVGVEFLQQTIATDGSPQSNWLQGAG